MAICRERKTMMTRYAHTVFDYSQYLTRAINRWTLNWSMWRGMALA